MSRPTMPMCAARRPSSARRSRAMCPMYRCRTFRWSRRARSSSASRTAIYSAKVAQARANVLTQSTNLDNSVQAQRVEAGRRTAQDAAIANAQAQLLSVQADMRRTDALVAKGWATDPRSRQPVGGPARGRSAVAPGARQPRNRHARRPVRHRRPVRAEAPMSRRRRRRCGSPRSTSTTRVIRAPAGGTAERNRRSARPVCHGGHAADVPRSAGPSG